MTKGKVIRRNTKEQNTLFVELLYKSLAKIHKGKGKSQIRSVSWGVPVREDTCPGPSAL